MSSAKLSFNKACMITGLLFVFISAAMITALYVLTRNRFVIWCGLLFVFLVFTSMVFLVAQIRRNLILFSNTLCRTLDDMMAGETRLPQIKQEESIFYKINHRLTRLYQVMGENRRSIAKERANLQELISDISHQVKTPIANLKMVNATLLEQPMPREKQREFLTACSGQLEKLDFLMQAMIKTSRLETGVISLEMKGQPVFDTLAAALGGILLNAEQKNISVTVDCDEGLAVSHDRKWTAEALFNILDNGVKYTPEGGSIHVTVESWEMYLKIDISDTGKGIAENHQGAVFNRFYREEEVHDIPGIGIGLYLAREIITMQGGYIKVTSRVGQGAVFSVLLPHQSVKCRCDGFVRSEGEKQAAP